MQLDTLTLCIVIALGGALIISVGMMFRSWRDASQSAYYFHRKQSLSSMQSYALTSVVLGVLLVALTTFAATPDSNSEPLIRVIRDAKPSSQLIVAPDAIQPSVQQEIAQDGAEDNNAVAESLEPITQAVPLSLVPAEPVVVQNDADDTSDNSFAEADTPTELVEENVPAAPLVADEPEPVEIVEETGTAAIKNIFFSTQINDGYAPTNPSLIFDSGYYTMYATFQHENMVDGTVWSWQWTRNGVSIGNGSRTWVDNPDGYGYVYFSPTEGFSTGDYQLTVWVNDQLSDAGTMRVTSNVAQ